MTTRRESMENMGTNDKTREKKAGNRVLKAGIGYTIGNFILLFLSSSIK